MSIPLTAATASSGPRPWSRSACQVPRSTIARTTARSAGVTGGLEGRVDERGERGLDVVAGLGHVRVDVGLVADRAQLRRAALVERERLAHQALDARRRRVDAFEQRAAPRVGQRDDLQETAPHAGISSSSEGKWR